MPLESIKEFQGDLKSISSINIGKLKKSIKKYGIRFPFFVWSDPSGAAWTLDGHQRIKALRELVAEGEEVGDVPVVYIDAKNEREAKELILLQNSQYGQMTNESLTDYFTENDLSYDDLSELLALGAEIETASLADMAAQDEPVADGRITARVSAGDIWALGEHRLACGDCTDPALVASLLAGEKPTLMVTDPPYGVEYDPKWRQSALPGGAQSVGTVSNDDKADWREAWALFPGDVAYVWHAGKYSSVVEASLAAVSFGLVSQIIWAKGHFAISRGDYHWQHEPCWYAVRKGKKHNWQGARDQSTLWEIANHSAFGGNDEEKWGHGTQKPIECMLRPILNNTKEGDAVYEPFAGSGTTFLAAERSKRRCYGIELDLHYCDMIVARWESKTARQAVKL